MRKINWRYNLKLWGVIVLLWLGIYGVSHLFYFNPSISEPQGYYFVYSSYEFKRGDMVLICVMDIDRAHTMHALGLPHSNDACLDDTPYLLKKIVAVSGDVVQIAHDGVVVNGKLQPNSIGVAVYKSIQLDPLPLGEFRLEHEQYFVLGDTPHSYDSRYFGIIKQSQIYRKGVLLWHRATAI